MNQKTSQRPLDPQRTITVVSGLPRSGTSMMMQMLERIGLELARDASREPDEDNPRGYYELEAVKRLAEDRGFVPSLVGRVVKVVSPLLRSLPSDYHYRVIFMERDLDEVLASQRAMLLRRGGEADSGAGGSEGLASPDAALARAFAHQLRDAKTWLADHENCRTCFVSHADVLASPLRTSARVVAFLESTGGFASRNTADRAHEAASERMADAVDARLHRQRRNEVP